MNIGQAQAIKRTAELAQALEKQIAALIARVEVLERKAQERTLRLPKVEQRG